jgi:hypothetical protein
MSCIPSIPSNLTPAELLEAKRQKLRYTSPTFSESKIRRLEKLTTSQNIKIRERAALDQHLPEPLQWLLVLDEAESVRSCLARNKNISWETFRRLAKDESQNVRAHIALNMSCPQEIIDDLRKDPTAFVRDLAAFAGPKE